MAKAEGKFIYGKLQCSLFTVLLLYMVYSFSAVQTGKPAFP
jgi:hypothetical protein